MDRSDRYAVLIVNAVNLGRRTGTLVQTLIEARGPLAMAR